MLISSLLPGLFSLRIVPNNGYNRLGKSAPGQLENTRCTGPFASHAIGCKVRNPLSSAGLDRRDAQSLDSARIPVVLGGRGWRIRHSVWTCISRITQVPPADSGSAAGRLEECLRARTSVPVSSKNKGTPVLRTLHVHIRVRYTHEQQGLGIARNSSYRVLYGERTVCTYGRTYKSLVCTRKTHAC